MSNDNKSAFSTEHTFSFNIDKRQRFYMTNANMNYNISHTKATRSKARPKTDKQEKPCDEKLYLPLKLRRYRWGYMSFLFMYFRISIPSRVCPCITVSSDASRMRNRRLRCARGCVKVNHPHPRRP